MNMYEISKALDTIESEIFEMDGEINDDQACDFEELKDLLIEETDVVAERYSNTKKKYFGKNASSKLFRNSSINMS